MLYVFYGSDRAKCLAYTAKFLTAVHYKRPEAEHFIFNEDNFDSRVASELVSAQGLFEAKHIVELRDILAQPNGLEWLEAELPGLVQAEHIFVVVETKILALLKKKLTEAGAQLKEFSAVTSKAKRDNFIYSIGDALGERNRQKLWLTLAEAKLRGYVAEEVFWQLWGMVVNLSLAAGEPDNQKLPVAPFVASKLRRFGRNYTEAELLSIMGELLVLYHETRRRSRDLDVALERWVLGV